MRSADAVRALAVLFAVCLFAAPVGAETFSDAAGEADTRLGEALRELSRVREQIAKDKIPLSTSVSRLERQVLELRRERDRLQKVRDSVTIDLSTLKKQVDSLSEQDDFIKSRLLEFTRDFEGRLDIAELARYENLTAAAKLADKNANLDGEGKLDAKLAVITAALGRVRAQLGGEVFEGNALGSDGILTSGRFVALGPTVFYVSEDGEVAGLVENQLNAADPVVIELPGSLASGLTEVALNGRGELPFDATLGKALKVEKARKGPLEYVDEGGVVGYAIIGLGAAALLLTLFKSREILGFPVAEPGDVDDVLSELKSGSQAAAEKRAMLVPGVAGDMLVTGVQHVSEEREVVEEMLFERILRVRPTLERFLPFLAITAAAAPLLGLLGTVIGMIKTFQLITIFGTGDAKSLSSGISEALVTTALGLIVAIPTLIMHGGLSRMAKHKLGLLEQISTAFVNGLSSLRPAREIERPPE